VGVELLLAQVARLLERERATLTPEAARAAIAENPGALGAALVAEAAASDDVTDAGSARAYLAGRLADLAPLLSDDTAAAVRAAFEAGISAW